MDKMSSTGSFLKEDMWSMGHCNVIIVKYVFKAVNSCHCLRIAIDRHHTHSEITNCFLCTEV